MAKKRVEHTPERDYVYTTKPTAPAWGTYQTPAERAAAQAASLKAANSPSAMRANEVAEATAQAEALRAADRGTGWGAYRTPEERAETMKNAASSPMMYNPNPLGEVDPIYQNAGQAAYSPADLAAAANSAPEAAGSKELLSQDYLDRLANRGDFQFNLNANALYQQYKDQYMRQGKLAMQDTIGQASALTGGYGNTYAERAGQAAYQGYLQQLNDRIPELYQLAMQKYQMEGDELKDMYSLLYGRERDAVEDERYQQEFDFKREQFDWSKLVDQHTMDLADKEFEESKNQFWANFDLNTKMYELDKWAKENQIQISWEELKQAAQAQSFDQAYKMLMYDYQRESDEKELAYKYYATDADNAYKYYAANLSNATNNRELDMRENGTYFDQSSGKGNGNNTLTLEQEAARYNMTPEEFNAYKAKFTGSVTMKKESDWETAVQNVADAMKKGTFKESMLYKYTFEQAQAIYEMAEQSGGSKNIIQKLLSYFM